MTFTIISAFAITVFLVSIIPGPTMLLGLTHGMKYGAKRSLSTAMGNTVVTLIQATISFVGLGAILMASELVFAIIKWAGAAYLIYLGWKFIKATPQQVEGDDSSNASTHESVWRLFWQGALITAGNPKAIVFFTAVFPQFIDTTQNMVLQTVVLSLMSCLSSFLCFMAYAVFGHQLVGWFQKASFVKIFNRLVGGTFIGSGIAIAMSSR